MGGMGKLEVNWSQEEIEVYWEIPNFISLSNSYHRSSGFKFLTVNWELIIDPFEKFSASDQIALHLERDDVGLSCNIMCIFSIKKADGSVTGMKDYTHAFASNNNKLIARNFFTRSALQEHESELMPSNTLTIVCKLKHLSDIKCSLKFKDLNTLSENFKSLSINKQFCDITLKLPGKDFQAHKLILATRSPVFSAMFKHETSEKQTGIVNIPDCDPESFPEFLDYIYSGELEGISVRSAFHLYKTADKYDVQTLKIFCVEYMTQNLKIENFCDVVVLAEEYDETMLFSAAQNFFNRNLRDILASDEWKTLFKKKFTLANNLLLEMATKVKVVD